MNRCDLQIYAMTLSEIIWDLGEKTAFLSRRAFIVYSPVNEPLGLRLGELLSVSARLEEESSK